MPPLTWKDLNKPRRKSTGLRVLILKLLGA